LPWLLYLPPHSPDLNPVERAFYNLKLWLRKTAARTIDELWKAISNICSLFTEHEYAHYVTAAGYGFN
jgi:transposase